MVALGFDANGTLIARADLGAHPFELHKVNEDTAQLRYLPAADALGQASYVADDGCVCLPGIPWIGIGSGTGCDPRVVTSFDRLVDTATCELQPNARQLAGPVCDGQNYGEPTDRDLPCFAPDTATGCAVITRSCHDADGVAYTRTCRFDAAAPTLPSQALCQAYRTCEQTPCNDVIGCFLAAVPASEQVSCTMRVDATTMPGQALKPCADGKWEASIDFAAPLRTGAACVSSVIEGVSQPPFHLGLAEAMQMNAQTVSPTCPPTLRVDSLDAPGPDALPAGHELDLTIGDQRVHVQIHVVRGCTAEPSLVCKQG
jgi:hypothetical protein